MSMNDKDLAKQLAGASPEKNTKVAQQEPRESTRVKAPSFRRKLTVLGLGDGGCKISSHIGSNLPEINSIGFNLSTRNEDLFNLDKFISADAKDGSGKDRQYAKEIVSEKHVMNTIVQNTLEKKADVFIISQSTGGGTGCGSGPKVSAEIADTLAGVKEDESKPVICIGVYPKLSEDKAAIYNTITWQSEITKIELPYMVFNNARVQESTMITHEVVNDEILRSVRIIAGATFEKTDVSSMDSQDFINLLNKPGRLNVYYTTKRPKQNESLDDFLMGLIESSTQELPLYPKYSALLIRGPKDLIRNIGDEIPGIYEKFGGDDVKYKHLEVADEVEIAFITSGSEVPKDAADKLQTRYQEMEYARSKQEKVEIDVDVDNPFAPKKVMKRSNQI